MKKIFAVIISVAMLLSLMSIGASAYTINEDDNQIGAGDIFGNAAVYFEDLRIQAGKTEAVELMLENVVGFTELNIEFALPEGISITAVEDGDVGAASLSENTVTVTNDGSVVGDVCIAVITLSAETLGEKTVEISATAKNGELDVVVNGSSCVVDVTDRGVYGDVNADGFCTASDLAVLKLYLAGAIEEIEIAADMDENGKINASDLAVLKLHLASLV